MQYVRIFEIPDCKMVSSGIGMFGDGVLEKFDDWFSKLPRGIYPKDFLFWDCSKDGKEGFQVELNADEQENENTLEVLGHSTWFRVLGTLCSMCR